MIQNNDFTPLMNATEDEIRMKGGVLYLFSKIQSCVSLEKRKEIAEELAKHYPIYSEYFNNYFT